MPRTLTLPMKHVYFDQIAAGVKPFEYRLTTPYWTKRLAGRVFDQIVLTKGYPKHGGELGATRLELPWRGYQRQIITHEHFGPDPVEVFAIVVLTPQQEGRMSLSPENRALVGATLWSDGAAKNFYGMSSAALDTLLNAARAEATTTQTQAFATALADLAVAEDALVSQTALVRSQGERVAALEAGVTRLSQGGAMNPEARSRDLSLSQELADRRDYARALLSPPLQDKEGAG